MTNKTNTTKVLIAVGVMSWTVGAFTSHILTRDYFVAKYEGLIEEEAQKAKAFYSQRNKTGAYSDPVKLAERLPREEEDDSDEEPEEEQEEIETDSEEEVREYESLTSNYIPNQGRDLTHHIASNERVRIEEDDDMESFERRIIEKARRDVEATKKRVGVFEEDEKEDVVTMNVFDTHGSSSKPGDGPHNNYGLDISDRDETAPFIISKLEFDEAEHDYNQNTLTYFEGDDILVDEREQPIRDVNYVVGNGNLRFGYASDDKHIVYVRNHDIEVDFEVVRSPGTFAEEVLGLGDPSRAGLRKFRADD